MNLKPWQKYLMHLALFVMEKSFNYLHKRFDIFYNLDDETFECMEKVVKNETP